MLSFTMYQRPPLSHRQRRPMISVMKMQTVQVVSWHCVPPPETLIHFEHGQSVPPQKGIRSSPGGYPGGNSQLFLTASNPRFWSSHVKDL